MYFLWGVAGGIGICLAILLSYSSHFFGYEYSVAEMPVPALVAGLSLSGVLFLFLFPLIKHSLKNKFRITVLLTLIFLSGFGMRVILFSSEPILEDDYQRYFLDGAITANGMNPYLRSPKEIIETQKDILVLKKIGEEAGVVLERINHPELRTIYPPVTQGVFALAYFIKPFDLTSWRLVLLFFDCMTFYLICQLLLHFNASLVWSSLYWWNPVIIKELFNSAHMEAILVPFMLAGILSALHKRYWLSNVFLILAAAVKIWPIALMAITLRPVLFKPLKLALSLIPALLLTLLLSLPLFLATFDQNSGFIAYATRWKTNSALFPLLMSISEWGVTTTGLTNLSANTLTRAIIVLAMLIISTVLFYRPIRDNADLVSRCFVMTSCIFLLSPAQFPWYLAWIAAFLPLYPSRGFLALTVTIPFYYLAFHYMSRGQLETFNSIFLWVIWLPVWGIIAFELYNYLHRNRGLWAQNSGKNMINLLKP